MVFLGLSLYLLPFPLCIGHIFSFLCISCNFFCWKLLSLQDIKWQLWKSDPIPAQGFVFLAVCCGSSLLQWIFWTSFVKSVLYPQAPAANQSLLRAPVCLFEHVCDTQPGSCHPCLSLCAEPRGQPEAEAEDLPCSSLSICSALGMHAALPRQVAFQISKNMLELFKAPLDILFSMLTF